MQGNCFPITNYLLPIKLFCYLFLGKCSDKDKTTLNTRAEVLLADVPVILDVFYTAKKLKWAQSTWAGNTSTEGLM